MMMAALARWAAFKTPLTTANARLKGSAHMKSWFVAAITGILLISSAGWTISAGATSDNQPPVVVATVPPAGDAMVNPSLQEIKITFSKPMQINGWSLGFAT